MIWDATGKVCKRQYKKYVRTKRKTKKSPLQITEGTLVMDDAEKAKVFNAFFYTSFHK